MQIRFNGRFFLLSQPQTLEAFLKGHSIEPHTPGIAVAVNTQIMARSEWTSRKIKEGDEIEVVHAVQGG